MKIYLQNISSININELILGTFKRFKLFTVFQIIF